MLLGLALLLALAAPPRDPIADALESYSRLASYRVTLRSGHGRSAEIIKYFYKKPGFVRMEFVKPHKGAVLVYDPGTKQVRLRPFGGAKAFVLTLSPDSALLESAHGHRVDQSDIGALLRRARRLQERGQAAVTGEEKVGGREVYLVNVEGRKGVAVDGTHRFLLYLDKSILLPLKVLAYDEAGNPVEEVLMDDLDTSAPIDDSLFRL